jgi:hypothetical protein
VPFSTPITCGSSPSSSIWFPSLYQHIWDCPAASVAAASPMAKMVKLFALLQRERFCGEYAAQREACSSSYRVQQCDRRGGSVDKYIISIRWCIKQYKNPNKFNRNPNTNGPRTSLQEIQETRHPIDLGTSTSTRTGTIPDPTTDTHHDRTREETLSVNFCVVR